MKFFGKQDIPAGNEFAEYGICSKSAYVGDYAGKSWSPLTENNRQQEINWMIIFFADVAASVNDPIFWPHHTNVDRVFSSWRKLHPSGKWEDLKFTYPSRNNSEYPDFFSEYNFMNPSNPWPGVLPPGDGNPTGRCEGHGLWDPTLRATFMRLFRSLPTDRPHTNLDFLRSIDTQLHFPADADYIYDSYLTLDWHYL